MNRSTLRIAIIVLTLITSVIHLALGIMDFTSGAPTSLALPFIANGIGYLALLAALFMNVPYFSTHRDIAHYLLMAFAAVTLIAFFVVNRSDLASAFGPAAIIAKSAEVLLIIATFLHLRAIS
jgi:hypothetical protein